LRKRSSLTDRGYREEIIAFLPYVAKPAAAAAPRNAGGGGGAQMMG